MEKNVVKAHYHMRINGAVKKDDRHNLICIMCSHVLFSLW